MQEMWASVPYFPNYSISSFGEVYNHRTERMMAKNKTLQGDWKVTLVNKTDRVTRSIRVLVAEAFVAYPDIDDPDSPPCDTVIVLDGNKDNVMAENLAWRPQWFAIEYAKQFHRDVSFLYQGKRIMNFDTGVYYTSVIDAAIKEGLLFDDVYRSAAQGIKVYPSMCTYVFQ